MTHFSRRVARAALIAAAGAAVPLMGAASAQASSLPLGDSLTGLSQPDQAPAAPGLGADTPAQAPADKLGAVTPAASETVGQTSEAAGPQVSDLADRTGSLTGQVPALGGLPL